MSSLDPRVNLSNTRKKVATAHAIGCALFFSVTIAHASESHSSQIEEVHVYGIAGTEIPLSSIPGAAQVINSEELSQQLSISPDIADALANLLPGYSPSNQLSSNFGQTFRGKKSVVLIDGVLQTTPIRNASREFMSISPQAIERIEIIKGSSALYGNGYAGGVINFVTRKAGSEPDKWTSLSSDFQPEEIGDTAGYNITQGFSGPLGHNFDYVVNLNYRDTGKFIDADGTPLPEDQNGQGGYANGKQYDVLLKLGYNTESGRFDYSYHRYHMDNHPTYQRFVDPVTGLQTIDTSQPYTGKDPTNDTEFLTLGWHDDDLIGQIFNLHLSVGDNTYRYATSEVRSKKYKILPTLETTLLDSDLRLVYGVDIGLDTTSQDLLSSNDCWICEVKRTQISPFIQAWYQLSSRFEIQLGVRREDYNYDIPSFVAVRGPHNGQPISGAELDYSDTIFNLGGVYQIGASVELYGGYSEGYAVDDLRRLRGPIETSVSALKQYLPATKSHNYEMGVRGNSKGLDYNLTVFYSRTENASQYGQASDGSFPYEFLIYADEEIKGLEISLDYALSERWSVGGSYSYAEGETKDALTGNDRELNGTRITPQKYTAYIEGASDFGLHGRLQVLHVDSRDKFDEQLGVNGYFYYESPIESYTTVDLTLGYNFQKTGYGNLSVAVRNLLDEDYMPASSQINQALYSGPSAYKAQGRAVTLGWNTTY